MKNCLVFLTKTFPFDTGEEFIANELPALSREFEKIFLLPTSVAEHALQTRNVPENTVVCPIRASAVMQELKPLAARYFFSLPQEYKSLQESLAVGHSPKRRAFLCYFAAKGAVVAQKAAALLKDAGLNECGGVTFYSYWLYDTALAALKLKASCKAEKCLAFSRAHRYDLYPEHSRFGYLPLRNYLLKGLDGVFPCSEDGSVCLKKACPEYAAKIHTAYLGTKDFGTGPSSSEGAFHIVSCCHISPVKRVELLAQALGKLSGSGLQLKWTHCGGGDGLEALKSYAKENLAFLDAKLPGEVKNDRLMELYRSTPVDLFVNTSSSEGLPVSIMEACSFGIPALATNVGGTSEIVRDGENGFLLKPDFTVEALAQKIEQICRMTAEERNSLRTASRKIWEENFNAEKNYARFAERIDALHH